MYRQVASLAERLEEQLRNKDKEGEKSFQLLTQELQAIEGAIAQLRPEDAANLDPADIHSANDEESLAGEHRVGAMEVDLQVSMADAGETSAAIRAPVDESVLKNIFGDDEALFDEILTDFEVSSKVSWSSYARQ